MQKNILILLSDQLRRSALGVYGDPNVATPNIDALAESGARFTSACSTYPQCVPFRFSLMTGQYPHSRMMTGGAYRMSPGERTLADEFNEAGYETMYVGKWHLYGSLHREGFETNESVIHTPVPREHQGRWQTWRGFEIRNDPHDTWYYVDDDRTEHRIDGYQTDGLFDVAMDLIGNRAPDAAPFCCVVSFEPPHPPFTAPRVLEEKWLAREIDLPPNFLSPPELDWDDMGAFSRRTEADREDLVRWSKLYYAMVENMDQNVGRMMGFLRENGIAEDTIVVVLSDHGESGGSHSVSEKHYPYEESVGIPLIVSGPGIPAGRVIEDPVNTEDLYPTLAGLAGISAPVDLPGTDASGLIEGRNESLDREGVLLEFVGDTRQTMPFNRVAWRGVRTNQMKYTVCGAGEGMTPWQLFDLATDPYELRNLVNEPEFAETAAHLHAFLLTRMRETGDTAPVAAAFDSPAQNVVPL